MTSSLVGSEMCIRDSYYRGGGFVLLTVVMDDGICSDHGDDVVGSFSSVSYTHLTLPTICSV
eukprot:5863932-Prorocentrum_lima.AAC.1